MKKVHVSVRCFPLLIALSFFLVLYGSSVLAQHGMEGNGGLAAVAPRADGLDGNPITARAKAPPHPTQDTSALNVSVSEIVVDGGFDEFVDVTEQFIAPFRGRRSTVEEFRALAEVLELLYHEAGYFLVRVTIPPQEVNDGDTFRLVVIDGYLEGVDVRGVPAKSRSYIESLLKPIVNRSRLTMSDFERALVLARQTPGLSVRTTIVPGAGVGASLLVVEGERSAFGASASFNTRLPNEGAPWNASVHIQLNQPFGRGEQLTANVSGPTSSLLSPMGPDANHRTVGGGIRWPVDNRGLSLHLGYSESHTYTPSIHWLIPATRSDFRRISLELSKPIRLSRTDELRVSATWDATDQSLEAPDFRTTLHRDGVHVLRLNVNSRRETVAGARLSQSWQFSQGLLFGSRSVADVLESGIPFSRYGAEPAFQKLSWTATWRLPFASRFALTSTLRGQYALKGPLPTTELFGLSGGNALPSLALGIGANDHGWTLREEVDTRISLFNGKLQLSAFGYVAGGATGGEKIGMSGFASAAGAGLRGDIGLVRLSLEYGRGWAESVSDDALVANVEVAF